MEKPYILSVTLLNEQVRDLLETQFFSIWVEGEISNFSQPSSGHWYFTLKDAGAQIKAAMFKGSNRSTRFQPENGKKVIVKGRLSLYAPRGDYQLIVEQMEEAGIGALQKAYEILRIKLQQEGLFDSARKKSIPEHIRHLVVITSPTGAAIQDILSVLKRRNPAIVVTIIPVPVQGKEAAPAIVKAFSQAQKLENIDAILLARGGGSLEDLWAFNEEIVARAIAGCDLPVISGVGHETDVTISDFVADVRAPTPSAAAELLSQHSLQLQQVFIEYEKKLLRATQYFLQDKKQTLQLLKTQLRDPAHYLRDLSQKLDYLEQQLSRAQQSILNKLQEKITHLKQRLRAQQPAQKIHLLQTQQQSLEARLQRAITLILQNKQSRLQYLGERAHSASPLAVMNRGYSIISVNNSSINSIAQIEVGNTINARLTDGYLSATITKKEALS